MPACCYYCMTTYDPSTTRPGRLILAAVVFAASLAAAGVAGWGWGLAGASGSQATGAHEAAIVIGQSGAIALSIATGFALPFRWRTSGVAGPLMLVQVGVMIVVACAGVAVARSSLPAPRSVLPPGLIAVAGLGIVMVLTAGLVHVGLVRRARAHSDTLRTGQQVLGVITDVTQTGLINDAPRWRVVTRFADTSGITRWVTTHTTTFDPPRAGQGATVHFDPARPGDNRHIVVSW
jgi:hypothetical protein